MSIKRILAALALAAVATLTAGAASPNVYYDMRGPTAAAETIPYTSPDVYYDM